MIVHNVELELGRGGQLVSRITSYNVCYTKLLRVIFARSMYMKFLTTGLLFLPDLLRDDQQTLAIRVPSLATGAFLK